MLLMLLKQIFDLLHLHSSVPAPSSYNLTIALMSGWHYLENNTNRNTTK